MTDASTCLSSEREELRLLSCQGLRFSLSAYVTSYKVHTFLLLKRLKWNYLSRSFPQGLVESLEIKSVVTLQEDIEVPPMPNIQVPERYSVYVSATSSLYSAGQV